MISFGTPHRHLIQCGSTNDEARLWANHHAEPAPSGALVTAEFQTQGRGQRGREWQAQQGESALMSFVYRPLPGMKIAQLGLVTALAVADAVSAGTSLDPRIKWPNDILLEGAKTAGILVEAAAGFTILGIGVNVGQESFPNAATYAYPPTSLRLATGQPQEIGRVTDVIAHSLSRWEDIWRTEGFAPIVEACRCRLAHGVAVRRGSQQAHLMGLNDDGTARVRLPDGTFTEWATVD